MDKATGLGFLVAIGMLLMALFLGGDLISYVSVTSALVTFGGAMGATMVNFTMVQVIDSLRATKKAFKVKEVNFITLIDTLVNFSERSRREGLLVLEREMQKVDDEFLKRGVQLVIDGTDQEMVESLMNLEVDFLEERHKIAIKFWEAMGLMMPAWGMVGTIIGLIAMLKNLSDPSAIGPAMAVALLTTFYGAVGANMVAIPIAGKLKIRHEEEMLLKSVMIEGVLSVQSGDNPRMVREKLNMFIAPTLRKQT